MFDWLFEGRQSVYLILAALAVIVAAVWVRSGFVLVREQPTRGTPKRRPAWLPLILGALLVLALGYFLLDRLVETPHEQITHKLQEMAAAVKNRDANRIFSHISDRFHFQGLDKAGFRLLVDRTIQQGEVEELSVTDIQFPDESGRVRFIAKPSSRLLRQGAHFLVRGEFVQDADRQWRLAAFELFNPFVDTNTPITIPTLP